MSKGLKETLIALIAIFITSWGIYHQTYDKSDPFDFVIDDKLYITDNQLTKQGKAAVLRIMEGTPFQGFSSETDRIYRPLTSITYALEIEGYTTPLKKKGNTIYQMPSFKLKPRIHHRNNFMLYFLIGILVYIFLRFIVFKNSHFILPVLATLIFVAHPLHVENVANIKGRDDLLMLLFSLSTLIFAFFGFVKNNYWLLTLSVILFFIGMFAKESTINILAVIPLTIYFFSRKSLLNSFKVLLFFLIPVVVYFVIRENVLNAYFERPGVFAQLSDTNNALLSYGELNGRIYAGYILLIYLKLFFLPLSLCWDYSLGHFDFGPVEYSLGIISIILHLGIGLYILKNLWKKNVIHFGIAIYLINLLVISNVLIFIGSTYGERLLLASSLGGIIALVGGLDYLFKKLVKSEQKKLFTYGVMGLLFLFFAVRSYDRTGDWKNERTLIESAHGISFSSRQMISYAMEQQNHFKETGQIQFLKDSESELNELILRNTNKGLDNEQAYLHRGNLNREYHDYFRSKKNTDLVAKYVNLLKQDYKKSLELNQLKDSTKINYQCYHNLGVAYQLAAQYDSAILLYSRAAVLGNDPLTYENMGLIYHMRQDIPNAIRNYNNAVNKGSVNPTIRCNLSMLQGFEQQSKGDFQKASLSLEKALGCTKDQSSKGDLYGRIGFCYHNLNQLDKAKRFYELGLQINPNHPSITQYYAALLQQLPK